MTKSELLKQLESFDDADDVVISVDCSCCYYDCRGVRVEYENPGTWSRATRCSPEPLSGWRPVLVIAAD